MYCDKIRLLVIYMYNLWFYIVIVILVLKKNNNKYIFLGVWNKNIYI